MRPRPQVETSTRPSNVSIKPLVDFTGTPFCTIELQKIKKCLSIKIEEANALNVNGTSRNLNIIKLENVDKRAQPNARDR